MTTYRFLLPLDLTIINVEWLEGGKADDGSEWLNFVAETQVIGAGLQSTRSVRGTIVRDGINFRAPIDETGECDLVECTREDARELLGGGMLYDMAGWWVVGGVLTAAVNRMNETQTN